MNGPLFVANLALVVLLLAATVFAGRTGRRALHYRLVLATVLCLVAAIVQAELFGRSYLFSALRLRIHLSCAILALLILPGVVWSGLGLARDPRGRPRHRLFVGSFLLLTLAAVGTALWMFLSAVPRAS